MTAEKPKNRKNTRRDFLRNVGFGATAVVVAPLMKGCTGVDEDHGSPPSGSLYNEKLRPQFHFTPREFWTNDPNGLVCYKGEYHMFFQHNPFGINWGNMTWAHAISTDLVHWKQLPNAIKPDELGTIFSGSAVVDWNNTAGFQTGSEKVLVAFYTSAGGRAPVKVPFTQSIAYSNDRGRTWIKYKDNPIIQHIRSQNRDPKVVWHGPTKSWIMALYLAGNDFILLVSKDLKQWTRIQDITMKDSSECPDFFELAVDGDPKNTRWVFSGADGTYLAGDFDGQKFTPETEPLRSRDGRYYAAQTWSDIPESDGRRLQIAWMAGGKFPGMPFNQQMSVPCELTLRTFPEGVRLCRVPARELRKLRGREHSYRSATIKPGQNLLADISAELFEIQCEIEPAGAAQVGFNLRGAELLYDVVGKKLSCKGEEMEVPSAEGRIKLHILVDRTSIEIFVNDGRYSLFCCSPLRVEDRTVGLFARDGNAKIKNLRLWKLKSIWT